jgi:hypothetical protein
MRIPIKFDYYDVLEHNGLDDVIEELIKNTQ